MRNWLALARAALSESSEIPGIPETPPGDVGSAISGISGISDGDTGRGGAADSTGQQQHPERDPAEMEERAAIACFDGGVPAAWCEGWARLQLMPPLPGFTADRWASFLDACGLLLDRHGRELHGLGWKERELFGPDLHVPPDRPDTTGLAFVMAHTTGAVIVSCHRDWVVIEATTGTRQRYWRARAAMGGLVPWRATNRSDAPIDFHSEAANGVGAHHASETRMART
jgi:hypothetical protein